MSKARDIANKANMGTEDVIQTSDTAVTVIGTLDIDSTEAMVIPVGATADRPVTPVEGMFRRNSETEAFEGYDGSSWGSLGGASGGGGNPFIYENDTNVTVDYALTAGKNGVSAGPIEINSGIEVTIPAGSVWTIV